jgi:hypothetical protein
MQEATHNPVQSPPHEEISATLSGNKLATVAADSPVFNSVANLSTSLNNPSEKSPGIKEPFSDKVKSP